MVVVASPRSPQVNSLSLHVCVCVCAMPFFRATPSPGEPRAILKNPCISTLFNPNISPSVLAQLLRLVNMRPKVFVTMLYLLSHQGYSLLRKLCCALPFEFPPLPSTRVLLTSAFCPHVSGASPLNIKGGTSSRPRTACLRNGTSVASRRACATATAPVPPPSPERKPHSCRMN